MTINTFAAAVEAARCAEKLDWIADTVATLETALSIIADDHPDIAAAVEAVKASMIDAVADADIAAIRDELRDEVDAWEEAA